ncbi:hypothetical protein POTOM_054650 [Populus tomentosa]|uniref:Uncharacterized protein n=1 Tax=Populus tomentosa TaxID=118781 RepID=A0A8X8C4Z3_POPTO|nr:hypothetical protein POTOM_054650 [Populus tomentosa]
MPLECDHLFVCIVVSEACETNDDESGVIIKFKLPTGIHVDDEIATSWDSFKEPFDLVLQACKPPTPCLQKTKVGHIWVLRKIYSVQFVRNIFSSDLKLLSSVSFSLHH